MLIVLLAAHSAICQNNMAYTDKSFWLCPEVIFGSPDRAKSTLYNVAGWRVREMEGITHIEIALVPVAAHVSAQLEPLRDTDIVSGMEFVPLSILGHEGTFVRYYYEACKSASDTIGRMRALMKAVDGKTFTAKTSLCIRRSDTRKLFFSTYTELV